MKEFLTLVFGDITPAMYLACFLFAAFGAAANTYSEVQAREIKSEKTPILFSKRFLILDNIKIWGITLVTIFIQFRFSKDMFHVDLNVYIALLMGFGADGLAGMAKRATPKLQADRDKIYNGNPYNVI